MQTRRVTFLIAPFPKSILQQDSDSIFCIALPPMLPIYNDPMRLEDAEQNFSRFLDSPSRQLLQLGIELPTSVDLLKEKLEKLLGCKEANGLIVFAIENLEGVNVGGISLHSCDEKNGVFSFRVVINREHWGEG